MGSLKANAPRGAISAARYAARAGKLRPTVICCEVADRNQYKKLLGNVRIKVREFGSEVVYCTDFGQQPRNKSRWAVVSPLGPRRRAAEKYHGGALALDESRAAPVRSGWARVPHRGRGNGRKVLR